jgi:hypothetical protein
MAQPKLKICFKCGKQKATKDFHVPLDGHLRYCRDCTKTYNREYRLAHTKELAAHDKLRRQLPNRKKQLREANKRYLAKGDNMRIANARYNHKPGRMKAKNAVARAVKSGKLIRPQTCTSCGAAKNIVGHHSDYAQPINVVWICQLCHVRLHRKLASA